MAGLLRRGTGLLVPARRMKSADSVIISQMVVTPLDLAQCLAVHSASLAERPTILYYEAHAEAAVYAQKKMKS